MRRADARGQGLLGLGHQRAEDEAARVDDLADARLDAICDGRPVRRTVSILPSRRELAAAKINTAASVGIRIFPTIPENSTRISSIHSPEKIDAQRPPMIHTVRSVGYVLKPAAP